MTIERIILLAGWAQAEDALEALGASLSKSLKAPYEALSVHALASPPAPHGSYAQALAERIASGGVPNLVVGWSMGAVVALETALSRPDLLISGVVTLAGTPCFCRCDGYEAGVPARELRAHGVAVRTAPWAALPPFFERAYAPAVPPADVIHSLSEAAAARGTGVLGHGLAYLKETDLRGELPTLKVPLLCLHGTEDQIIPHAATEAAVKLAPHAAGRLFEGAGHAFPVLDPGSTAAAIQDWLAT